MSLFSNKTGKTDKREQMNEDDFVRSALKEKK